MGPGSRVQAKIRMCGSGVVVPNRSRSVLKMKMIGGCPKWGEIGGLVATNPLCSTNEADDSKVTKIIVRNALYRNIVVYTGFVSES